MLNITKVKNVVKDNNDIDMGHNNEHKVWLIRSVTSQKVLKVTEHQASQSGLFAKDEKGSNSSDIISSDSLCLLPLKREKSSIKKLNSILPDKAKLSSGVKVIWLMTRTYLVQNWVWWPSDYRKSWLQEDDAKEVNIVSQNSNDVPGPSKKEFKLDNQSHLCAEDDVSHKQAETLTN